MDARNLRPASRMRHLARASLVLIVLLVALGFGLVALFRPAGGASTDLPERSLERLDGGTLALPDLRGEPLVINLWATWCPPCRRELPLLQSAANSYPDVYFLFANQGESRTIVEDYLAARDDVELQNVVLDGGGLLTADLNALGLPTTYFFDADGRLAVTHVGEVSSVELINYLADLRR